MKSKHQRIIGLDILRVISLIAIFCYHYLIEYVLAVETTLPWMHDLSYFFNVVARPASILLFAISGYALIYNNEDKMDIRTFYVRRFKSLFIPFYVCYSIMFFVFWVVNHHPVGAGVPKINFIYTIMGIDGLMSFHAPNFYLIGEWFMTCIVICYLVFPVLAFMLNKAPRITLGIFLIWYLILLFSHNPFSFPVTQNPFLDVVYFYIGMFLRRYFCDTTSPKWFTALCAVFSVLVYAFFMFCNHHATFISIAPDNPFGEILNGLWSLALIAAVLPIRLSPSSICSKTILYLANISWYVLLLHHSIIALFYTRLPMATYPISYIFILFIVCILITSITCMAAKQIVRLIRTLPAPTREKNA